VQEAMSCRAAQTGAAGVAAFLFARRPNHGALGKWPQSQPVTSRRSFMGWMPKRPAILTWSLALVWLAFFCDHVLVTMAIPIFPLLRMPEGLIGPLFASKAACQILSSPFMGRLVDKYTKPMVLLGLALETCSILTFAFTFDFRIWFLARALSGVASTAIVSGGFAHLNRSYTDKEQRAVAMGLATTGIIGGVCIGPVLGGLLYEAFPSLPFCLLAAMELMVGLLAWARWPVFSAQAAESEDATSMLTMVRHPDVLKPLGALVVANSAISCLECTIAKYLVKAFGCSTGQVGALFLLVSAPSCIMSGVAGPIGNRLGRAALVRAGLVTMGLFAILGPKHLFAIEVVSLIGLGAGMGMIDGAAPSLLGDVADDLFGGTGKLFVLSDVAVQTGFVLGPVLGGALAVFGGFSTSCLAMGASLLAYAPLVRRRATRAMREA